MAPPGETKLPFWSRYVTQTSTRELGIMVMLFAHKGGCDIGPLGGGQFAILILPLEMRTKSPGRAVTGVLMATPSTEMTCIAMS